ncbi:MAG: M42 family metallopeptidase [Ruminococcaceae bacterium]|nr:M42 family metallopeptidase [Oscillospiraceae bacterium]
MLTILKKLCETSAASGNEEAVAKLIAEEIRPYVDEVYTDALGNLIAHKKGTSKKLMFAAHMDEIGLVATCYGEKGQVYVAALGGVSPQTALYQRVRFSGGAEGVLVPDGKLDELGKNLSLQKMYVDLGAKNEEEAKTKVALGETGVFGGSFVVQDDCIISKALDNRAGCAALIYGLQKAENNVNDVYGVFTVSEELGLRGAKAAAVGIQPDYAVALDVTPTGDVSSTNKRAVALGEGVAVKIMDRSFIAHPIIKDRMVELCEKHSLAHQLEVLEMGGTDAGAIHLTCGGVPSGCISVPVRYVHTPGEMISARDLQGAGELAKLLIEEGIE